MKRKSGSASPIVTSPHVLWRRPGAGTCAFTCLLILSVSSSSHSLHPEHRENSKPKADFHFGEPHNMGDRLTQLQDAIDDVGHAMQSLPRCPLTGNSSSSKATRAYTTSSTITPTPTSQGSRVKHRLPCLHPTPNQHQTPKQTRRLPSPMAAQPRPQTHNNHLPKMKKKTSPQTSPTAAKNSRPRYVNWRKAWC